MLSRLPSIDFGTVNVLRYQPSPPGKYPVALPFDACGSCSMLQSCGSVTVRQEASGRSTAAASGFEELPYTPDGSVVSAVLTSWNFHPWSKSSVRSPWLKTPSGGLLATGTASSGTAAVAGRVPAVAAVTPRRRTPTASVVRMRRNIRLSSGQDGITPGTSYRSYR